MKPNSIELLVCSTYKIRGVLLDSTGLLPALMSNRDTQSMDSLMSNDDPEHEFLLSQVIRSTSPDRRYNFSTETDSFEYVAKRRPAFRDTKSEDQIDFSASNYSKQTSSTSSEKSVRETFELQLNQLQTALEASMIENSKLKDQLVGERARASTKFDLPSETGSNVTAKTMEVEGGDISFENIICEKTNKQVKEPKEGKIGKAKQTYQKYTKDLYSWFWDFLSNFHVEDNEDVGEEQKEETFAPSMLSENISRLTKAAKPYSKAGESVNKTLCWNKRAETLVLFLLYMISAYTGYTLQVLLIFMIWRLSVSYIIATGLANRFGIFSDEEEEEEKTEEKNWVDKVAMARVILLKVQTITGGIADSLEKINNLMMWRIPEVTMKLYRFLWVGLIASMFLPTAFQLKLVGIAIGIKIFVITPMYKKYPRVKEKYDSIGKLWSMLPTNEGLNMIANKQGTILTEQISQNLEGDENRNSPQREAKERHVLTKFGLTTKEKVLDGWFSGKRANLMNRSNLMSGYKSGKLYLTTNHICYEKMNATNSSDRIKIELKNIQSVSKAKPFQILPGSGMSIEISMKEDKSFLFSAIFNRDEVFKDIIENGLSRGHEWAIRHEES